MESRWKTLKGLRLAPLTNNELPDLARAIVGHIRKKVDVKNGVYLDQTFVCFTGPGVQVLVRGEDWNLILPYLKDGSFNPLVIPDPQIVTVDRTVRYEPSVIPYQDRPLYIRVLNVLTSLFPLIFPVSKL